MSLDISQITEIVANDGYDAMFESYDAQPVLYPMLGRIIDPLTAGVPLHGTKGSVFMGHTRSKKRLDLQQVEKSTTDLSFTWYASIEQYSIGMTVASRTLRANSQTGAAKASILDFMSSRGEVTALEKDDFIAGMFQKGSLTAGDATYFDGSFPGEADPYPKFIYDGLPWFDTAHTLSGSSTTLANHVVTNPISQANIQTRLTAMTSTNAINGRGERIMIRPDTLLVPPGLEFDAKVIMGSMQAVGSGNNDVNPIAGRLVVVPWNALSDAASASSWWLGARGKGLRIYDSGAPEVWVVQEDNGDITINTQYYFGAAVDDFRFWDCNNKAAS